MADREKVISEGREAIEMLERVEEPTPWCDFIRNAFENAHALLKEQEYDIADMRNDLQDTLAENLRLSDLLKAQEPVEPTIGRAVEHDGHDSWWYQCGKCEKPIDWQDNYCRHCGRAVKWE